MRHQPELAQFLKLAKTHRLVPVYRQLVGDTLTPVIAFRKIQDGDWSFLFESVIGGERLGRYSFLGSSPFLVFQAWGNHVEVTDAAHGTLKKTHADPLKDLEEMLSRYRTPVVPGLPRFSGGAVGYAGYDSVRYVERLPNPPPDDRGLPDLCFAFYDRMVIFDHINKTIAIVAHAHVDPEQPQRSYEDACRRVDELVARLQRKDVELPLCDIGAIGSVQRKYYSNCGPGDYERAVEKAKEYIRAGDIFQVVLSQRFTTQTTAHPFDIYRTLRVVNPSPFMFYLSCGPELRLVGSSPEIMVRVEGDKITIRPLAGTRKRGQTEEEDQRLADELIADPKERAEHIMLVDLGRNDVGRVARYGSVQLSDVMQVERYSHVMHICSNVTRRLEAGQSAFDALAIVLAGRNLERPRKYEQCKSLTKSNRTAAVLTAALSAMSISAATWTRASLCARWC